MFALITPTALLALTGLLVPVAIHFWNRRPGREVAVGSLRWLVAGANRRLRNLKLEQFWLLLLRAALLAVLAVAVAGPVWRTAQPASRGVVLLSREALSSPGLAALRQTIDSLRRRGYALRWLASGFGRIPGATWRPGVAGQGGAARDSVIPNQSARFAWARVRQAVAAFPGQPLFVVTATALRNFEGGHPPLPATVTWQVLPTSASHTWLQAAAAGPDSLRLLLGYSTEAQTRFRHRAVARPQPGAVVRVATLPPFRFEAGAADSQLNPLNKSSGSAMIAVPTLAVHTKPLRIVIYSTAGFAPDARYLQAGLRAAALGLPVPLALSTTARLPDPVTRPDWLFWLSEAPVPTAWRGAVRRGTTLWQEAAGPGVADTAHLVTEAADAAVVAVFRRGRIAAERTAPGNSTRLPPMLPVWTDGLGRAVLTRQAEGQGAIYHLNTRLNPTWSELADAPALPAQLLVLLQPETAEQIAPAPHGAAQALAVHDQRTLDPAQLFANRQSVTQKPIGLAQSVVSPTDFRTTDLRQELVLLAGLLFMIERLLAHRREARALTSTV